MVPKTAVSFASKDNMQMLSSRNGELENLPSVSSKLYFCHHFLLRLLKDIFFSPQNSALCN